MVTFLQTILEVLEATPLTRMLNNESQTSYEGLYPVLNCLYTDCLFIYFKILLLKSIQVKLCKNFTVWILMSLGFDYDHKMSEVFLSEAHSWFNSAKI